ncbi:DUF2590 family protein [uncultured Shewanella sp.]|uniref:DUF2590 family protein n=1 Tax=uncultured Shewanella sp. TaxID=173975 RepID=UPI0026184048|nr:DUF2590 family protein [uncultured Shewanella sp.]
MIHIDLNILDGDLDFNSVFEPSQLTEAQVIAQDIKHRIIESGMLTRLIKLRNNNAIAPILTELELEVEKDDRLIPGTIELFYNSDHTLSIHADTRQYHINTQAGSL